MYAPAAGRTSPVFPELSMNTDASLLLLMELLGKVGRFFIHAGADGCSCVLELQAMPCWGWTLVTHHSTLRLLLPWQSVPETCCHALPGGLPTSAAYQREPTHLHLCGAALMKFVKAQFAGSATCLASLSRCLSYPEKALCPFNHTSQMRAIMHCGHLPPTRIWAAML